MYQPTLWRRRAGLVKPSGIPRIDWSHPLAKGLVFYGFDTGEGRIIDLVAGRPATFVGTPPTLAPIPGGYGYGLSWGGGGSAYFPQDTAVQVAGELSFACAYLQTGAVGSYATVFCRTAFNNGQQPYVNWGYELNAGGGGQNIGNVLGNASDVLVTSPNWTGNASDVFTVVDGVIDQGFLYFHAQGQDIGSIACAQTSENTNADLFFSGTNTAAAQNEFVGFILFGAMWRRALSQSEAQLLAAAPWDFLRFPADFSRGRARRFALSGASVLMTADAAVCYATVGSQTAERPFATESAGHAVRDTPVPFESLTVATGLASGEPLRIEASATLRRDHGSGSENLGISRSDAAGPIESSGAAQFIADAGTPLEIGTSVSEEAQVLAEAAASSLAEPRGCAAWLATAHGETELSAATLAAGAVDEGGLIEWLGTGATAVADLMLPLEWRPLQTVVPPSVEAGPSRVRLVSSPGRVRLLRRS